MAIYVGTSGWSYTHWRETFYPKDLPREEWLDFYSKKFNTVELNMTFYRFPSIKIITNWKNKIPKSFLFSIKATRLITHQKKFHEVNVYLRRFLALTERLDKNLACILFQTPPLFEYNQKNFAVLKEFLPLLDKEKRNVFEFRHKSWWNQEVFNLLKTHNVCLCTVSGFGLPESVEITSDFAYFRFHGPDSAYSSEYTEQDLKKWAEKIKSLPKSCKDVFIYFNNDVNAYAIKNAEMLKGML